MKTNLAAQVYDFQKWRDHRSPWMTFYYIITMFNSGTMKAIRWTVLWLGMSSILVGINFTLGAEGILPRWLVLPPVPQTMGIEPLALTSFAIALLLVFRTNVSYARFDDGRKLFGLMLNRSRDIVRQGTSFMPEGASQSKATLARWTIVFTKALMCHMQDGNVLLDEVQPFLTPEELAIMSNAQHPTVVAIQVISLLIKAAPITEFQRLLMNDNVTTFEDILGGCERILKTPIPVGYTRHTCRCVMLWLTFFPYIVWNRIGWFVVPVTVLTAVCLVGIMAIGDDIEEPFSILPIEAITERAHKDIVEIINTQGFMKRHLSGYQNQAMNEQVFDKMPCAARPSAASAQSAAALPGSLPLECELTPIALA